ncbi:MAG: hypothetical protein P8H53_05460, partial [Paracoccaceae bacterium]|nr:hypothetical protein [Paracoccaceae bacterium]
TPKSIGIPIVPTRSNTISVCFPFAETYETELETLAAWMELPQTRNVILDTNAANMGFAWFQEPNGKVWWTLVMGS